MGADSGDIHMSVHRALRLRNKALSEILEGGAGTDGWGDGKEGKELYKLEAKGRYGVTSYLPERQLSLFFCICVF